MRFWSVPPPLTLKPEDPSEAACTPGKSWMVLMTSTSPIKAGIFLMVIMSSVCTLIAISETLRSFFWLVISTSDSWVMSCRSRTFKV